MIRIPLDHINDNPFQTRLVYDFLRDLADSIAEMRVTLPETAGLIQVPLARLVRDGELVDTTDWTNAQVLAFLHEELYASIELAVGHRRLRAFADLAKQDVAYETFPVELRALDDQAMADIAWQENEKRADISDIERAVAIDRAMQKFDLTQAQIGARWQLSQSAVANLLRLLKLPEKAQGLIRDGQISGRHGRALLPLVDLGARWEAFLDILQTGAPGQYHSVAEVEQLVVSYIERDTYSLSAVEFTPEWDGQGTVTACAACPQRVKVGRDWRCQDVGCYHTKQRTHKHTVKGPAKANVLYNQLKNYGWTLAAPPAWKSCGGCGRVNAEIVSAGGREQWLAAEGNYICPLCMTAAKLKPTPTPAPETHTPVTVIASAPVTPPVHVTPPAATVPPPAAPLTVVKGPLPAPAKAPTTVPAPQPAPTPATILTARIMPSDELFTRRVLVSIGDEGRGPAAFSNGTLEDLPVLVMNLVAERFPELAEVRNG